MRKAIATAIAAAELCLGLPDAAAQRPGIITGIGAPRYASATLLGTADTLRGVQLSALACLAGDAAGVQAALFSNTATRRLRGLQLAGITNIAAGARGVQAAAVANVAGGDMHGAQLAAYNYADTLRGVQLGLMNSAAARRHGWQVGLINISADRSGNGNHKIGLLNIGPDTRTDLLLFAGNSTKTDIGLRVSNGRTYSIFGLGTHFLGLDDHFSGAVFYRLGQSFPINDRLSIAGDLGFYHIETFATGNSAEPNRLYSLQARATIEYQLGKNLGLFATGGWGDTRRYHHSTRYRQRAIVEAGLSYRLTGRAAKAAIPTGAENSGNAENSEAYGLQPTAHPWLAALEVFGINCGVQLFDRFGLDADFAQINFSTMRHNIENGFVWDNDQFSTNLFAHPYHGGLYFNAARTNGLGFWQSLPYSFGGSLMWEELCEIEPPAINDLMATTIGGACIGEVTFRLSDLVLDDSKRGWARFGRELLGAIVCPIKALNRIISGDAWRVRRGGPAHDGRHHDFRAIPVRAALSAGGRYLADQGSLYRGESTPYINVSLVYGDPFEERCRKPYDYFSADITFGLTGNQPLVSGVHLLGQLWATDVATTGDVRARFGIYQHFNYYDSQPVKDGTSLVPFRISEAASFGPGFIYELPRIGNAARLEQRIFLDGIILGGSLSDHYNVIDRDYNMGSGYSAKVQTSIDFGHYGLLTIGADFYQIFTWKGYEHKPTGEIDPLYLNAQGDKSSATLLVVQPRFVVPLGQRVSLDIMASYYWRRTHYHYYDNVQARTFTARLGLAVKL